MLTNAPTVSVIPVLSHHDDYLSKKDGYIKDIISGNISNLEQLFINNKEHFHHLINNYILGNETALILAAKNKQKNVVAFLLKHNANMEGDLLGTCVTYSSPEILSLIWEKLPIEKRNHQIKYKDKFQYNLLTIATRAANPEMFTRVWDKLTSDERQKLRNEIVNDGSNLLMVAVCSKNYKMFSAVWDKLPADERNKQMAHLTHSKDNLLILSVRTGNEEMFNMAWEKLPDTEKRKQIAQLSQSQDNLLFLSVQTANVEMFNTIWYKLPSDERNKQSDYTNEYLGHNLLKVAAQTGNLPMFKTVWEKLEPKKREKQLTYTTNSMENTDNALAVAARSGNVDIFNMIWNELPKDALSKQITQLYTFTDSDGFIISGENLLMQAVHSKNTEMFKAVLNRLSDEGNKQIASLRQADKKSLLHLLANVGNVEMFMMLWNILPPLERDRQIRCIPHAAYSSNLLYEAIRSKNPTMFTTVWELLTPEQRNILITSETLNIDKYKSNILTVALMTRCPEMFSAVWDKLSSQQQNKLISFVDDDGMNLLIRIATCCLHPKLFLTVWYKLPVEIRNKHMDPNLKLCSTLFVIGARGGHAMLSTLCKTLASVAASKVSPAASMTSNPVITPLQPLLLSPVAIATTNISATQMRQLGILSPTSNSAAVQQKEIEVLKNENIRLRNALVELQANTKRVEQERDDYKDKHNCKRAKNNPQKSGAEKTKRLLTVQEESTSDEKTESNAENVENAKEMKLKRIKR